MEQENRSFIHDTINLDEIKKLLSSDGDFAELSELEEDISADEQDTPVSFEDVVGTEVLEDLRLTQDDIVEEPEEIFDLSDVETPELPTEQDNALENASAPEADEAVEAIIEETKAELEPEQEMKAEPESGSEPEETSETEKKKTSALYELYCMLHDVIYLLAFVTLLFVFVVRLVGVQGDSMLPTLHNRDYLLLESNFLYHGDDLEYGDIVVLNVPYYEERGEGPIVKRVIATEGETVDIDFNSGAVYVNGVMLQETYINAPTNYNWDGEYGMEYPAVVPENCIFVLGDNRNNSMDSRYAPIGMIDERCVLGKVLLIAMPGQTTDELGNVIDPREWGRIGLVS